MELVANRFALIEGARAIDLATGDAVLLRVDAADAADRVRWAVRCDTLAALRHAALAVLADYGLVGATQRFEAWRVEGEWRGPARAARRAIATAGAFLDGCDLAADVSSVYRSRTGAPVVVPRTVPGSAPEVRARGADLADYGVQLACRRATSAVVDVLDHLDGSRPTALAVCGPPESGRSTFVREIARAARLRGLVPVRAGLFVGSAAVATMLEGRTILAIDDGDGWGWHALLSAAMSTARPHVLLIAADTVAGVPAVVLEPIAVPALVAAVRPSPREPTTVRRVGRAALRAGGRPGRFVTTLWPEWTAATRLERARSPRAAERPVRYGADEEPAVALVSESAPTGTWPAPGELVALRGRLELGVRLLACGRRAPGERTLRQAVAALARRNDRRHAAVGAIALARSLVRRGRAQAALQVLAELRRGGVEAGEPGPLVDASTLATVAWTDLGRLDEAEAAGGSAIAAAAAHDDTARLVDATLALGRCLFWRGRYEDADRALAPLAGATLTARQSASLDALAARLVVGLGDAGGGVARAASAVDQAERASDAALVAHARSSAAFAHLAVGDLEAVDRDVAVGLRAARAAHDPLRAVRLRVLLAERSRRVGRSAAAAGLLPRTTGRLAALALPPIVRARCDLIRELGLSSRPLRELVSRHVAATGFGALALFAPASARGEAGLARVLQDALDILGLCQYAQDEEAVLADVCDRLRRRLRAAGVGFFANEAGKVAAVVARGGRIEPSIAARAVAAGITVSPHRCADRIEAAVPVRYAGATVGALAARWTLGSTDPPDAPAILGVASTASAPVLSALLAGRARAPAAAADSLIGTSAAVAGLRRAAERAAAAPFPVLIAGESGSGKELVARAVHRLGPRRDRAFCTLNCAAIPDDLLEAELFGHARGAFTGAVAERPGVFEDANGGTLFLDEVGELSARGQAKLLRVVQEGELRRVGENAPRRIDVRIVAATNRDLSSEAAQGRFRIDLLYRLDVLRIVVPPLRERREDVAVLAEHVWREATARLGSRATLAPATLAALARYDWPGNVRELQNVLAALAVRTPKRGVVPPNALPPPFGGAASPEGWRLDEARRTFEERFVRAALVRAGGHRIRAAAELGVTRQGLAKLMTRLGIRD